MTSIQATPNPAAFVLALSRKVPVMVLGNRITGMSNQPNHFCWQPCRAGYVIRCFNQHKDCKLLGSVGRSPHRQSVTIGRMIGLSAEGGEGLTIRLSKGSWIWAKEHATERHSKCKRVFRVRTCKYTGEESAKGHLTLEHMCYLLKCLYGRKISISQRDLDWFALYLSGEKEPTEKNWSRFHDALIGVG